MLEQDLQSQALKAIYLPDDYIKLERLNKGQIKYINNELIQYCSTP